MGEFVWGFDNLADVSDGVTIFGSARTRPSDPHYAQAVETARLLAQAGIPVITGGGPGIMEAANRGAMEGGGLSIGCNIELPFEQGSNAYLTPQPQLQVLLRAQDDVREVRHGVHRLSRRLRHPGRAVRGAHPDPDRQGQALPGDPVRHASTGPGSSTGSSDTVAAERKINPKDLQLFRVTDDPGEAARIVIEARAEKPVEPTAPEFRG